MFKSEQQYSAIRIEPDPFNNNWIFMIFLTNKPYPFFSFHLYPKYILLVHNALGGIIDDIYTRQNVLSVSTSVLEEFSELQATSTPNSCCSLDWQVVREFLKENIFPSHSRRFFLWDLFLLSRIVSSVVIDSFLLWLIGVFSAEILYRCYYFKRWR